MGTLEGFALVQGGVAVGYVYYAAEAGKGLIGDFFVRDAWRSPANENRLLAAVVGRLSRMPWLERIEAQLMHLGVRGGSQLAAGGPAPRAYPRQFMLARLSRVEAGPRPAPRLHFERWSAWWTDAAAELIAEAYRGHVDSAINNQYESAAGARRFLDNIVRYPGCGYFAPDCSWVALDADGELVGACFATRIGPEERVTSRRSVSRRPGRGAEREGSCCGGLLRRCGTAVWPRSR